MKGLKKISTFFFWCCLPFLSLGQTQYLLTEENFDQTVETIYETYQSQIGIDYTELYDFLLPLVEGTVPNEECTAPDPMIDQVNLNSISFSWEKVPTASYYSTFHFSLENGSNGSADTDVPKISFDNLQGLNLFGFSSNCEGPRGPWGIIVADLAVLFPSGPPPLGENCLCVDRPLITYNLNSSTSYPLFIPWPTGCAMSQYELSFSGDLVFSNSPPSAYNSLIIFQHFYSGPYQMVGLMSKCDRNATSSSQNPNFIGDSPNYFVDFQSPGIFIYKGSTLNLAQINVTRCRCSQKGDDGLGTEGNPRAGEVIEFERNHLAAAPNPTTDQLNLVYEVTENGPITITAYDALGRQMSQVLNREYREIGVHQMWIDMNDWPTGMYTFEFSTAKTSESIIISKQ